MNILCIAAHPDDEVLGCGGTLRRHVEEGDQVYAAFLGNGVGARSSTAAYAQAVETRMQEAQNALAVLGFPFLGPLGPSIDGFDNRFDTVPMLLLAQRVEESIRLSSPDIIYTHHPTDLNIDHSLTAKAVITATRPKPGCKIAQVYAMESISSLEWGFGVSEWKPDHFVELTYNQVGKKADALGCYESELMAPPHPRSVKNIWSKAVVWGSVVGVRYAEAFQVLKTIRYLENNTP